ncbi:unnamed protein product [Phytophthora fragariaefolia]|uniref:Unnamed protein product n=1 Tax=Phytophthora fragariaefolia TaxID=1490495 RepID=A0A9W6YBD5_9STRA|nr:unnamed protein product [Phytophthora fragariaefolia]
MQRSAALRAIQPTGRQVSLDLLHGGHTGACLCQYGNYACVNKNGAGESAALRNVRPRRSRRSQSRSVVEEREDIGDGEASQQSDHSEDVRDIAETEKPQRDVEPAETEETPVPLAPIPTNLQPTESSQCEAGIAAAGSTETTGVAAVLQQLMTLVASWQPPVPQGSHEADVEGCAPVLAASGDVQRTMVGREHPSQARQVQGSGGRRERGDRGTGNSRKVNDGDEHSRARRNVGSDPDPSDDSSSDESSSDGIERSSRRRRSSSSSSDSTNSSREDRYERGERRRARGRRSHYEQRSESERHSGRARRRNERPSRKTSVKHLELPTFTPSSESIGVDVD